MSFYTEHRMEGLLERETRMVPGPGGERVSIDAFRVFWKAYDFLVFFGIHSADRLAAHAHEMSLKTGEPFGKCLNDVVWLSNADARRLLGIDCFGVRAAP